ncbi:hypothetical protein CK203_111900 [Vitis vinifera]|uniref:Uncharacterized protein n=1 Tax=Vitis vinifera TaxID=29760 RepID=A0A438CC75_VITVI|nr:hypothetical protein CK203_111900 [Vitis vinifera]
MFEPPRPLVVPPPVEAHRWISSEALSDKVKASIRASAVSAPPTESQIPSGMTPEVLIRHPMLTQPPTHRVSDSLRHDSEVLIRHPMLTQPPLRVIWDCKARPFHSELCFDTTTFRLQPELRTPSICCRDGRHGILGARHIAEALRIPYEPARPEDYRVWTHLAQSDIVHILSKGASTRQYLLRKEAPS